MASKPPAKPVDLDAMIQNLLHGAHGTVALPKGYVAPKADFNSYKPGAAAGAKGSGGGGSMFGNTFHNIVDYLQRPLHATAGFYNAEAKGFANGSLADNVTGKTFLDNYGAGLHSARRGLDGKEHKSWRDVETSLGYTGLGAGTLGTLGDLILDPANLAGGAGIISKGAKVAEVGEKLSKLDKLGNVAKGIGNVTGVSDAARGARFVAGKTGLVDSAATKAAAAAKIADVAKVAEVPVKASNKGKGMLKDLLAEHPLPKASSDNAAIAEKFAPADVAATLPAKVSEAAAPVAHVPYVAKTYEDLKAGVTDAQKAKILAEAEALNKKAFAKHPLSKTEGVTLKGGVKVNGFKGFSWKEIMADAKPGGLKESLYNDPAFSAIRQASLDTAKAKFVNEQNKALEAAHVAQQATPTPPPAVPLPIHEGAANAIMDVGHELPAVNPDLAARVNSTREALNHTQEDIAKNAAHFQHDLINADPEKYKGRLTGAAMTNMRSHIAKIVEQGKGDKFSPHIQSEITKIYSHAEALMMHNGLRTSISDINTTPIQLSHILPHMTPDEIVRGNHLTQVMNGESANPAMAALHDAAVATSHIHDATAIHGTMAQLAEEARAAATSAQSVKDQATFATNAVKTAEDGAKAAGASEIGVQTAGTMASEAAHAAKEDPLVAARIDNAPGNAEAISRNQINVANSLRAQEAVDKKLGIRIGGVHSKTTIPLIPSGKLSAHILRSISLERNKISGLLTPLQDRNIGRLATYVAGADRHFRTAFDSALGMSSDMHAARQGFRNATESHIADNIHQLSEMKQGVPQADFADAYRQAQAGDFTNPLAKQIHDFMDNIYGTDGYLHASGATPEIMDHGLNL